MNFDYVLIDSPPLESVADAMLIGSQTTAWCFCVEGGSTAREPRSCACATLPRQEQRERQSA